MKAELMNDLEESIEESIKTSNSIGKIETLEQENEDLRNRSMISTFGIWTNDSWEEVSQNLVVLLAAKLNLDPYELNMQISRVHRTPKSYIIVTVDPSLPNPSAGGMSMRLEKNSFSSMPQESQKPLFHRCFQKN